AAVLDLGDQLVVDHQHHLRPAGPGPRGPTAPGRRGGPLPPPPPHPPRFPGPAAQGSIKLALARTTRPVSMRVTGQSADGRTGTSDTLNARRLLRRVVLQVQALHLDIPH